MKINNISITSRDIEIISEALDELAQSYRDFQDECPEDCNSVIIAFIASLQKVRCDHEI